MKLLLRWRWLGPLPMRLSAVAVAPVLLSVGFGLVAVVVAAHWFTRILAPGPVLALPAVAPLDTASALKLFTPSEAATRLDGVRLTGVYANGAGDGFAAFATENGPVAVGVGGEVVSGVVLHAVGARLVVLDDRGREVRLELPLSVDQSDEGKEP